MNKQCPSDQATRRRLSLTVVWTPRYTDITTQTRGNNMANDKLQLNKEILLEKELFHIVKVVVDHLSEKEQKRYGV